MKLFKDLSILLSSFECAWPSLTWLYCRSNLVNQLWDNNSMHDVTILTDLLFSHENSPRVVLALAVLMTLWGEPWRDAALDDDTWHVTSPVSPGPGLGVSCIFLWRRHFAIVALACREQGRQWPVAHWVLLPGLRRHNPIIRSQSHIMSPDTSTLLTLAWLVSDIASG